ncbi:hypothetical protein M9Y10_040965 [Tritrichomonas musculus]|uniref:Uncharacterized protein n=1 Tax=Tritrichomonas musculus TaxID=1915356 RepID=A0ABR2K462_9EUKA
MNEITNIINDYSFLSNEKSHATELHTVREQINSSFNSLQISMIQLRQILNILNSQFYNSFISVPDVSQSTIKLYYELFQTIVKSLQPVKIAIQNPNIYLTTSTSKFETLYYKFIADFIELLLVIDLPKELFNPIGTFFSPLLIIFMRNLANEKTNILQEDFTLIAQLNQSSFTIFESVLKSLYTYCFDKIDLLYNIIQVDDNSDDQCSESIKSNLEVLRSSLIWTKKNTEQYQIITNSILSIRCELISRPINKLKAASILNEIESNARIGFQLNQALKSFNEFIEFLNLPNQNIKISSFFSNCGDIQHFYENAIKLQLLELEKFSEDNLIPFEFYHEMKSIFGKIFEYHNNSLLTDLIAAVDIQLCSYHNQSSDEEKKEDESSFDLKKRLKEEFDMNLRKNDPPKSYDDCINTFLEFIKNLDIVGEIPATLEKDMLNYQFVDIVSSMTKDRLNCPIKSEIDQVTSIINDMRFLADKIITINSSNNCSNNYKSSMFLSTYICTIEILLLAKEKYKNSTDQFELIIQAFRELIPPPDMIRKIMNIDTRFHELEKASRMLINEPVAPNNTYTSNNDNKNENNDQQVNDASNIFFSSNDTITKLVTELELATLILSFIEKNENFIHLICCTEFSLNIWPPKNNSENEDYDEKELHFDENGYNASLTLLSLFKTDGFNFDHSPQFFINWIAFNFSIVNTRIQATDLINFVPFCDYSDLSGKIINCCTLIELYVRNNNSEEKVTAVESMKLSTLAVFTALSTSLRLDEIQLTKQILACIKESCSSTSTFKKINVLCHTVLTKIYSFAQLFEFFHYAKLMNQTKINSLTPIEIFNYSLEILKKLRSVVDAECLPFDFRESADNISQKISQIINDPEMNPRPLFFSQGGVVEEQLNVILSLLNEVRKIVNKFDISIFADQVSSYIDEIVSVYEREDQQNENDCKHTFSPDVFNSIFLLKTQMHELLLPNKTINKQILLIKIQLILENSEKIFPKLEKPLQDLYDFINISYVIYSIKTMLNLAYFSMSHYCRNGILFQNWFEGEFNENSIFCKEDENINTTFTNLMESVNNVVSGMTELENGINNILSEHNYYQEINNDNSNNPRMVMKINMLNDLNSTFQSLAADLKSRISKLNDRKIRPEVPQLEQECDELVRQFMSFPNQTPNLAKIYKKVGLKILPSSNQLVTKFESESIQLVLKDVTIKEKEKKIELLNDELKKRQRQINQNTENSIVDTKKKQRERSDQIIKLIKDAISDTNETATANTSNDNINYDDDNGDNIPPDDPNYETFQRLKKQLSSINQDNLRLRDEIRELQLHHNISREDQIELLMNKSINFQNPNTSKDFDVKHKSSSNKKDNDALNKRISQSIEKMKKKIQIDKKQGSSEASIIKLFKDIRPRGFTDTLISEDIYKSFTKSTRERADKIMKEWRSLRNDLALYEQES